jgi:enoyl-CoA hydratase
MKRQQPLLFEEVEPGIGLVTMNRPERLNALDFSMIDAFDELFLRLEKDEKTRVVVLTGAGRGFCSGADLSEAASGSVSEMLSSAELFLGKIQKRYGDLVLGLRRIPQPVIAAVNGPAAGGGFALALAADVRLAVPEAFFIASFINIGLSGGEMGTSFLLPRAVGLSRASEILMSGRRVPAEEAERIGLVNRLEPRERLVDAALELARMMLQKTPGGLALTKRVIERSLTAPSLEWAVDLENRNQTVLAVSSEFLKQIIAFGK